MPKGIKRKLDRVYARVTAEMHSMVDRSNKFSGGLNSEGYHGGYLQALNDVQLALNGVKPATRGWWREE